MWTVKIKGDLEPHMFYYLVVRLQWDPNKREHYMKPERCTIARCKLEAGPGYNNPLLLGEESLLAEYGKMHYANNLRNI